jgi:hypothetical protein
VCPTGRIRTWALRFSTHVAADLSRSVRPGALYREGRLLGSLAVRSIDFSLCSCAFPLLRGSELQLRHKRTIFSSASAAEESDLPRHRSCPKPAPFHTEGAAPPNFLPEVKGSPPARKRPVCPRLPRQNRQKPFLFSTMSKLLKANRDLMMLTLSLPLPRAFSIVTLEVSQRGPTMTSRSCKLPPKSQKYR